MMALTHAVGETRPPQPSGDPFSAILVAEIDRIVTELGTRLHQCDYMAAISSIHALVARSHELGEHCGGQIMVAQGPGDEGVPSGELDAGYL